MKKINKKYIFSIVFLLAWFLTLFYITPEFNNLKLFIITSIYFYIGAITVVTVRMREQYQQLQTKTRNEYLIVKGSFENEVSLVVLIATCTIVEMIYCCLHEFTVSSFLHGLIATASFSSTIYFVIALVFQKRCKTLVNSTKSLADIEMDKSVLRTFQPFQKKSGCGNHTAEHILYCLVFQKQCCREFIIHKYLYHYDRFYLFE